MGAWFRHILLSAVAAALCWPASALCDEKYPEFVEQVFLAEDAALKAVFAENESVTRKVHAFTREQKSRIESQTGWTLAESSVTVFEGRIGVRPSGWAMVCEEIGKFKPMTFMVRVSADGKVERVEVMVYREPVGAEVRRKRFWGQFRGKTVHDRLRLNRDILNITGATMSVQAMTAGVRKSLVIISELYGLK